MADVREVNLEQAPTSASEAPVVEASAAPTSEEAKKRLEEVRLAFKAGDMVRVAELHAVGHDLEAAKAVEDAIAAVPAHEEKDASGGDYVKSIIFGGLDGIITTFAIVAGSYGAGLSLTKLIILGFANVVADGFSMGFGEFTSSKAEQDYVRNEQKREEWEIDNYPEGEVKEMVEVYQRKGLDKGDAVTVATILSKYKQFWLEHMMVEELGLLPADDDVWGPAKQGLVMFCSFCFFGSVPLIAFIIFYATRDETAAEDNDTPFIVAACVTAATLFFLGVVKAKFTQQKWFKSGALMLINGTVAGGAAYGIGELLNLAFE